jgi:membrane associated rhomboid family serine protease
MSHAVDLATNVKVTLENKFKIAAFGSFGGIIGGAVVMLIFEIVKDYLQK